MSGQGGRRLLGVDAALQGSRRDEAPGMVWCARIPYLFPRSNPGRGRETCVQLMGHLDEGC